MNESISNQQGDQTKEQQGRQKDIEERKRFQGLIREIQVDDLSQIREIFQGWVTQQDTPDESVEQKIERYLSEIEKSITGENKRWYVAAEENGEVIGIAGSKEPDSRMRQFAQTESPLELINMYVRKGHDRGKGVGTNLVNAVELHAVENGFTEIILISGNRFRETGWGFYDQLKGFEKAGIAYDYYQPDQEGVPGHAPVWRKQLSS